MAEHTDERGPGFGWRLAVGLAGLIVAVWLVLKVVGFAFVAMWWLLGLAVKIALIVLVVAVIVSLFRRRR